MNADVAFSRLMLAQVRAELTPEQRAALKDSWVYRFTLGSWEFHGPNGFYWHGPADNAYDARAKGIEAWTRKDYANEAEAV